MDVSWGSLDMDNNGKVAILDEISKSMMGIEVPDNDCLMSQLVIYLIMPRIACQGYKRIILLLSGTSTSLKGVSVVRVSASFRHTYRTKGFPKGAELKVPGCTWVAHAARA